MQRRAMLGIALTLAGLACGGKVPLGDELDDANAGGGTAAGAPGQGGASRAGAGGDSIAGAGGVSMAGAGGDSMAGAGGDSMAGAGGDSMAGAGGVSMAGAAGDSWAGAGGVSMAGAGGDSTAGAGSGIAGSAGVAGAPLDAGPEIDAGLAVIAARHFVLWVDREALRPTAISFPRDQLPESAYQPMTAAPWYTLSFSTDGTVATLVSLEPDAGTVRGQGGTATLQSTTDGIYWFDVSSRVPGGRVMVWQDGSRIEAEVTWYGSGVPIIESARGELRP